VVPVPVLLEGKTINLAVPWKIPVDLETIQIWMAVVGACKVEEAAAAVQVALIAVRQYGRFEFNLASWNSKYWWWRYNFVLIGLSRGGVRWKGSPSKSIDC
jgi:hypothetical protein